MLVIVREDGSGLEGIEVNMGVRVNVLLLFGGWVFILLRLRTASHMYKEYLQTDYDTGSVRKRPRLIPG